MREIVPGSAPVAKSRNDCRAPRRTGGVALPWNPRGAVPPRSAAVASRFRNRRASACVKTRPLSSPPHSRSQHFEKTNRGAVHRTADDTRLKAFRDAFKRRVVERENEVLPARE